MGNRTVSTLGTVSTSYTDDELTATSGGFVNGYGYNANGEQTSRTLSGTAYTLAYDYDGQLTSTGTGGATFAYDAEGRRVSRTAGSTTTAFLYDGGQVLLEKQGSTTTGTYTYGNGLVRKDTETPLFDGLGSARAETNGSGSVTATLTLAAFGQTVASTGTTASAYGYGATSGYRTDGDAGLTHVGARYYDAQVGRFITRDTRLDQRPYAYCDGDPVNATDPSGHGPVLNFLFKMFKAIEAEPEISAAGLAGGSILGVFGALTGIEYLENPAPGVYHNGLGAVGGGFTALAGVGLVEAGAAFGAGAGGAALLGGAIVCTGGAAIAVIGLVTLGVGIYRASQ